MDTRTYWLSFTDPTRPSGDQFLGVALVDVDVTALRDHVVACSADPWMAAALRTAHRTGCNPGGEVLSMDMTPVVSEPIMQATPRNVLMDRATLRALGHIE